VSADREALAASQSSLLDALLDGGVPAGFDPRGVGVAARGLLLKRRRSVARAWPGLALALGQGFGPLFAAYAKKHDLPAGGALVDGRLFARELKRAGNLPPEALPYLLEFDLVRAIRGGVVVERRLPGVRMAAMGRPFRLLIGFRNGGGRIRCFAFGRRALPTVPPHGRAAPME